MTEHDIIILRHAQARDGELVLGIDGRTHRFNIDTERLETRLAASLPDRLLDFLDIAGAVFAADSAISRGGSTRSGFGESWRRCMKFQVQVREPEFWNRRDVADALGKSVEFLSDDDVSFDFHVTHEKLKKPVQLAFDTAEAFNADDIILFSGGLDSLSGVVQRLECESGNVALVTHHSAQFSLGYQKLLVEDLKKRFSGRILWFPVSARRAETPASETTQRTRSFLFAALGYLAMHMLGAKRLCFYENGVVSQNLPISPQVIGTMATRTTHPLALRHLARLLELVAGAPVALENPFAGLTKAEVIARLVKNGGANLIRHSVSCSDVRHRGVMHSHCGRCSQCIDRRMAVLASGSDQFDPAEMYETDVFSGRRDDTSSKNYGDQSRILALDWTQHAHALADMTETGFLARFSSDIMRVCDGYPDRPSWEVAQEMFALQRRHGQNVRTAIAAAVGLERDAIAAQSLPSTSLLRMFLNDSAELPSVENKQALGDLIDSVEDRELVSEIFPLQVVLEREDKRCRVTVLGLGAVEGASAAVVGALEPIHNDDRLAERPAAEFRYTPNGTLSASLKTTKAVVAQRVTRCRAELAQFYELIEGAPPQSPLLIENKPQRGYRIDPTARFVEHPPLHR